MHQIARSLRVGVSIVQRVGAERRQEREHQQIATADSIAEWEKNTRDSGWRRYISTCRHRSRPQARDCCRHLLRTRLASRPAQP